MSLNRTAAPFLASLVLAVASLGIGARANAYSFEPLGELPGATSVSPTGMGISADGSRVVGAMGGRPFLSHRTDGLRFVPDLPGGTDAGQA